MARDNVKHASGISACVARDANDLFKTTKAMINFPVFLNSYFERQSQQRTREINKDGN